MRNLRLDLCYDGSRYKGWQRLPNTENTIQAKLESTLSRILGEQVEVVGSGRTDAGTHAKMQVVNVHCNSDMPCDAICNELHILLQRGFTPLPRTAQCQNKNLCLSGLEQ